MFRIGHYDEGKDIYESTMQVFTTCSTVQLQDKELKAVTEAVDQLTTDSTMNAVIDTAQASIIATEVYLRPDFAKEEKVKILLRRENVTFHI